MLVEMNNTLSRRFNDMVLTEGAEGLVVHALGDEPDWRLKATKYRIEIRRGYDVHEDLFRLMNGFRQKYFNVY